MLAPQIRVRIETMARPSNNVRFETKLAPQMNRDLEGRGAQELRFEREMVSTNLHLLKRKDGSSNGRNSDAEHFTHDVCELRGRVKRRGK